MEFLKARYGTYNLKEYPLCIQQLVQVHKIQCQRRKEGWKNRKIILPLPWQKNLLDFDQSIAPNNVDPIYDHILFLNQADLAGVMSNAQNNSQAEQYKSKVDATKLIDAPKGIHIQISESHRDAVEQCIRHWFSVSEIFWLK